MAAPCSGRILRIAAHSSARSTGSDEKIELVCTSGHRTSHSLARVLRLNDGWCGKCGADISYKPLGTVARLPAEPEYDVASDTLGRSKAHPEVPTRKLAALATACESDDPVAAQHEESSQ